ncbi:MAG TPA: DUF4203 domain-containing protein, partial [Solirubrobacter sp.]|nr:DUF4203 domain-containing protein [Solirubrobacter sp.]
MDDVLFGIIAILAGAVFCLRGYLAFRIVIPLWGAFVGFGVGAGIVASATGDGFLQTGLAWVVGIAVALAFGLLAYLFYNVAVIVAMGSIGFTLGTTLMLAFGVSWSWLIVLAGVAVGVLLAWAAIVADLPMALLVVLSALGGSSAIVAGLMVLFGTLDTRQLDNEAVVAAKVNGWWWLLYAGLAVVGVIVQARSAE